MCAKEFQKKDAGETSDVFFVKFSAKRFSFGFHRRLAGNFFRRIGGRAGLEGIHRDGREQDDAEGDILPVLVEVEEVHAGVQHADDEHADDHVAHFAAAAAHLDAAEHRAGHDGEFRADAHGVVDRADLADVHDLRNAEEEAGQREDRNAHLRDRDARERDGVRVGAEGVDVASKARLVEDERPWRS